LQHISARCRDTYSETGPTSNVEMLDGCFWAMRRSSLEAIGFLDGSFPFMGEDMDWCRRCRGAGWYVAFVPEALVVHTGGASSASAPPMKFVLQGFRARQMYFLKHGGRSAYWVCRLTQTLLEVRRLMAWVCLLPFWRGHRAELGRNVQRDWSALKWLLQRGRAELAAWE
ncbi:MAG: glycosyltransferase, partial [Candidatus Hydrogenedentes bacterium]|nr:glycosyltransferase [Candidatus Hydrogenedentota bacterium]